jgi:hypothetical protein
MDAGEALLALGREHALIVAFLSNDYPDALMRFNQAVELVSEDADQGV